MVALFPGAPLAVAAMAVAMEAGKLVTVAFLARYKVGLSLRVTLVALVAGIAAINGLGVFSQLVAAHLGDRIERAGKAETGAAALGARVESQAAVVGDFDRRVAQIDSAIAEMIRRGRNALAAIDQQRQNRETLVARWRAEVEQLASLKADEAAARQEATAVQSETAPIVDVAVMLGAERQDVVRWLILLMVLCADPLAIALTAAASAVRK